MILDYKSWDESRIDILLNMNNYLQTVWANVAQDAN